MTTGEQRVPPTAGGPQEASVHAMSTAPLLTPPTARPTPRPTTGGVAADEKVPVVTATPRGARKPVPPTEVTYPRLGLTVPVVPTGVTRDGQMEIPGDAAVAGWYRYGMTPSDGTGNTVIAAHNGSPDTPVGPFNELAGASIDDEVRVRDGKDGQRAYRVVKVEHLDKGGLDFAPYFSRTGAPSLVLVTCGGRWLPEENTYSENVIMVADPVD